MREGKKRPPRSYSTSENDYYEALHQVLPNVTNFTLTHDHLFSFSFPFIKSCIFALRILKYSKFRVDSSKLCQKRKPHSLYVYNEPKNIIFSILLIKKEIVPC